MKTKTLLITKEGYLFLQDRLRRQRGGRLTPPIIKHLEKAFEQFAYNVNGKKLYEIDKYSWGEDLESIKKVLDKNNLYYEEKQKNFTFKYENDLIIISYKGLEVWGADLEKEEINELSDDCFLCDVILEGLEVSTLDKDNYFYKKIDNNKQVEKALDKIVKSKTLFEELKTNLKIYLLKLKKGLK